jgi:orotidine-5'-phosphate decarboxylase
LQDLESGGKKIWQIVAEKVATGWNENGNCMLVVGATYPEEMAIIRKAVGDMTLLVPGVGTQGGSVEAVMNAGKNSKGMGLIINSTKAIIFSDDPAREAKALRRNKQVQVMPAPFDISLIHLKYRVRCFAYRYKLQFS